MRLLALSIVAFVLVASAPAEARQYVAPWCAVISAGWGTVYWDCRYASIDACRPNVIAGNKGYCVQNPAWAGPPPKRVRVRSG